MLMIFILGLTGLIMGSFVTAFVDRLHDGRDWVRGRSECDSCNRVLAAQDLIPVLSWLVSRGHCRYCGERISSRYPLTELVTGLLFVLSYLYWPYSFEGYDVVKFVVWCVVLVGFVAMSIYDLRWMILPNKILYPLLAIVSASIAVESVFFGGGTVLVRDSVLGLLACGGVFFVLFQISKGKWIGGGDVKLGFLLGLLSAGWLEGLLVIVLASFIGVLIALPGMAMGRLSSKAQIPFGPLLVISGIVVYLYGQTIIDWYFEELLLL